MCGWRCLVVAALVDSGMWLRLCALGLRRAAVLCALGLPLSWPKLPPATDSCAKALLRVSQTLLRDLALDQRKETVSCGWGDVASR